MATNGRKRTPTALKVVAGTYRSDRDGPPTDAAELLGETPPPRDSLGEVGQAKWMETAAVLIRYGLLEVRFLDALEMYCRAWDRMADYEVILAGLPDGGFVAGVKGGVVPHPVLLKLEECRDTIRRYQQEFGLTPSSAGGVKVSLPKRQGIMRRNRGAG